MSDELDPRTARELREMKAILVLIVLFVVLDSAAEALDWHVGVTPLDAFPAMTHMLFGDFIVPFEVLGFLLLAALMGALYYAHREVDRGG